MYQIVTGGNAPLHEDNSSVFSFLPKHMLSGERDSNPEAGKAFARGDKGSRSGHRAGKSGERFGSKSGGFARGGDRFARGGARPFTKKFDPKKGINKQDIPVHLFINKEAVVAESISYTPKHKFADFNVSERLIQNLAAKGIVNPSPIQDQAIPILLEGKDVIGIASTGTGKTAAFLVPIINKIVHDREQKAIILTPTRELAFQIENEFVEMARGLKMFSVSCVGGASLRRQMTELEKGVHVIIGTPGRVKDLIERNKIDVSHFQTVVLDEADRMLDMGFIDDMKFILARSHKDRQTLFFSATFGKDVQGLTQDFMKSPITISLRTRDTASAVAQDVVYVGNSDHKIEAIKAILSKPLAKKVIIFREMKREADELATHLKIAGFKVHALHGDMDNRDRARAVREFSQGSVQAVVATDVAARGIDIPDVSLVINYDIPQTYETYVHRIGRTGRGNKVGYALTFVHESQRR